MSMSTYLDVKEEQARERLAAAGIDPAQWGDIGGMATRQPRFALSLAGNLKKLTAILEGVVVDKQGEVRALEEKLLRLKFGGGS